MKNIIPILIFSLVIASCGNSKKKTKPSSDKDTLKQNVVTDTLPHPMMVKVNPLDFKGMMEKVPFGFDEKFIRENKIKQITCNEDIVSEGKTIKNYSKTSWMFNAEGKMIRYLWEDKGNGKVKKDTLIYKNGVLVESGLIMYLRGPEPDITQYSYSDGQLVKTRSQITEDMFENITYKYLNGKLSEEKNDLRGRTITYQYKGDTLIGYTQKDPESTNKVIYNYDSKGRLTSIKNSGEYNFEYPITYNVNGQMKEMKWIEEGNPFVDFVYEFDALGKLITIKNKGYSAAWHESETQTFSYEYY